ncbi:MAG: YebC/PmpR family DNA-binding transcriptional regulator, partial [Bacteroidales bacterium]
SFNEIQKYLESAGFEIVSAEFERIPNDTKDLTDEQRVQFEKMIDKIEDDEDVQNVYHNAKESESDEDEE